MNEDIIAGGRTSSPLLRALLIASPFFLFLYYAQVSSENIKQLKQQLAAKPTIVQAPPQQQTVTPPVLQTPHQTIINQPDTNMINNIKDLNNENRHLNEEVDSLRTAIAVIKNQPPATTGNNNAMADSFRVYRMLYLQSQQQLKRCLGSVTPRGVYYNTPKNPNPIK